MSNLPPASAAVSLWAFCDSFYREPGVEAYCLQLQDNQQVNVLVLLWSAWLDACQLSLSPDAFIAAARATDSTSRETVVPLRQLRRRLKARLDVPDDVRREARDHLLQAELVLEKQLLNELEVLTAKVAKGSTKRTAALTLLVETELLEVASGDVDWFGRTAADVLARLQMSSRR